VEREHADYWLRLRDPWEVEQRNEAVEIRFDSSFEMHGGSLRVVPGPSLNLARDPV
jgi:hypothetical protein